MALSNGSAGASSHASTGPIFQEQVNPSIRVNDNAANDCTDQFQPSVIAVATPGQTSAETIFVSWYDRRNAINGHVMNYYIQPYVASSTNGGASFSTNVLVPANGNDWTQGIDPTKIAYNCAQGKAFIGDDHEVRAGGACSSQYGAAPNTLHGHIIFASLPYSETTNNLDATQWALGSRFWGW